MKLDTKRQKLPLLYHFFDWMGMPMVAEDILSYKDCLGRLILMWIAYGMPDELEEAIESCLASNKKEWVLWRHPRVYRKTSRDHWSYFIIYRALKSIKHEDMKQIFLIDFLNNVPRMRGMNLWMKTLQGNKRAEKRFYRQQIIGAFIRNRWNKFCRVVGFIYRERSIHWWLEKQEGYNYNRGHSLQIGSTGWQRFWGKARLPAYALHNKGWQLFVLPESDKKETLKKILGKPVGTDNLMVRLLMGDLEISEKEILDYPNTSGYPSGVYLDEACRRDIHKLPFQANLYEKALLLWLYYELKRRQFAAIKSGQEKVDFLTEHKWLGLEIARRQRAG